MLDAGSPVPTFVRMGVLCAGGVVLDIIAALGTAYVYRSFGIIIPAACAIPFALLLLCLPAIVAAFWDVRHTEFVISDGCLCGVDLWTVEHFRYGKHCIWLDGVRISGVPKPKVLLQSLEDYYIRMTGECLP